MRNSSRKRRGGCWWGDWLGDVSPRRGGPRRPLLGAEGNQDSGQVWKMLGDLSIWAKGLMWPDAMWG